MLRWRLLLGTLIVAIVAGLCWLDATARAGRVAAAGGGGRGADGQREVLYLARAGGHAARGLARVLRQPAADARSFGVPWRPNCSGQGLLVARSWLSISPLAVLALGLLLIFVAEIARYEKPGGILANIGVAAFALLYVGLMLSFAVRLRMGWGIVGLASWIIAVKMGDIGAYTVGRLIGRHKMAPRLSPGKTIEGRRWVRSGWPAWDRGSLSPGWCRWSRDMPPHRLGLAAVRPGDGRRGHPRRSGRVARETRCGLQRFQHLAARFWRRAGYPRFALAHGPPGLGLLGAVLGLVGP